MQCPPPFPPPKNRPLAFLYETHFLVFLLVFSTTSHSQLLCLSSFVHKIPEGGDLFVSLVFDVPDCRIDIRITHTELFPLVVFFFEHRRCAAKVTFSRVSFFLPFPSERFFHSLLTSSVRLIIFVPHDSPQLFPQCKSAFLFPSFSLKRVPSFLIKTYVVDSVSVFSRVFLRPPSCDLRKALALVFRPPPSPTQMSNRLVLPIPVNFFPQFSKLA